VDPDTLLLTPETLRAAITPRTRAVMVVHLYGQLPDMDGLAAVADAAGLFIVEDAAQAHGARWRGRRAGSFGVAGCFSFYPGKNLGAAGDAGAVVTDDADLAERIRVLRNHGRSGGSHHAHTEVGTNSRLDTVQAVVLSAKLAHLDEWNAARRERMEHYRHGLAGTAARLVHVAPQATPVHHLAVVCVPQRAVIQAELAARGIASGIHYPVPCHQSPAYAEFALERLPVAEAAADEILSLPLSPHMPIGDVQRVCRELSEVLASVSGEVGHVA
jgi:dTDP-4-amino-4,6-dideoxygalactose transaminase